VPGRSELAWTGSRRSSLRGELNRKCANPASRLWPFNGRIGRGLSAPTHCRSEFKMPLGRILDGDGDGNGDGDGDDNELTGAVAAPTRQWGQGIVTAEDHAVRGPKCG